jgi:GntR family transcriptional regulator of vanillate catabolism
MPTAVEKVTLRLRDMIFNGEFEAGARIAEVAVAERLGVSRTPVRWALSVLETEGLVQGSPGRGFRVRSFAVHDVLSAYEVRGALEGLAARRAAERGLTEALREEFEACLAEGEDLVKAPQLDEHSARRWSAMNDRFHHALLAAADCPALEPAYEAVARIPAAAPGAVMFLSDNLEEGDRNMRSAHADHKMIVEALNAGQATRAEYLVREHIYQSSIRVRRALEREASTLPSSPASPASPARTKRPAR